MELSPWINHSWGAPLYVTSRGLTTSPIPHATRTFEIDFDFLDHVLSIETNDAELRTIALEARSVAQFYHELVDALAEIQFEVSIHRGSIRSWFEARR